MSRFGDARWQRLAAWSGAALAWGSTITAVVLEPARDAPSVPPSQSEVAITLAPLPAQPGSGLLVIRYQPDAVEAIQPIAQAPVPAPAAPAAPQPTSSGS
jgi:hypothetical protein